MKSKEKWAEEYAYPDPECKYGIGATQLERNADKVRREIARAMFLAGFEKFRAEALKLKRFHTSAEDYHWIFDEDIEKLGEEEAK